ncbi:BlaI/MecI/CopY family transcriptional regulator [Roseiconus lacunae]|uniref:BlaI/MecI/CopY family transcriptional regulator n=1 Tax=Roseiconus lacunae TaxID=2605694 RepID=UPI003086EBFA|nr:BlaI/MecI/CopY family transcriptional regulator [Stieleria sp. HD01]
MNDQSKIHITDAEWGVMEGVWRADDQTAGDVLAGVTAKKRSHRTLRTLLARLVEKGAVKVRVDGSQYRYTAAVTREACIRSAARSFAERFFNGDVHSLLSHFVEYESLTDEEVQQLRRRLASRETKTTAERSRKSGKNK